MHFNTALTMIKLALKKQNQFKILFFQVKIGPYKYWNCECQEPYTGAQFQKEFTIGTPRLTH
jgi:hypothetical protein